MKYKVIELSRTRTVRHKAYVVDTPSVKLVAHLEDGDMDILEDIIEDMRSDLQEIVDREVAQCKEKFEEEQDAKNK